MDRRAAGISLRVTYGEPKRSRRSPHLTCTEQGERMIRITMLGTGYVGLVTGACLAELGNQVTCTDIDSAKIHLLERGQLPFYEPGLGELVEKNRTAGRLAFELDPARAVSEAQVVFIAVGTPPGPDGSADLSAVLAACHLVAESSHGRYKL